MSGAPALVHDARTQWLMRRKESIGASEVAAILGVDPRRGPLAVYASKVGDIDAVDTKWMRWGRRVEGAIAEGYTDETNRPNLDLGAYSIHPHPHLSFLTATLDRVTCGSATHPAPVASPTETPLTVMAPLEIKAVSDKKRGEWEEDLPLEYVTQLQAQLSCTGAAWGSLCALIGGLTLTWKDLLRNDDFLAATYPLLEEFWMRVQRRQPPEADGLPGTSAAVRRLWAAEDGETVPLDAEALALVLEWEAAKTLKNSTGDKVDMLENQIRQRLGSASFGKLPGGSFIALKLQKRGAYSVQATEFRVLRRFRPKVPLVHAT